MNGAGNVVSESTTSGLGKKILNSASKAASKSVNYVTDSRNTFTIIRGLLMIGGAIASIDYVSAEGSQRTSYATRGFEVHENGTYSPDPDTRSKAAALRRRGIDLSDCCEPNSKRLNPELVENKYEIVRPYESRRYLALEEKASALEEKASALKEENSALEEKASALKEENSALEEKASALEEENRKLRLGLEGPSLE